MSSVTNRANAGAEGTPVAVSVSRPQANTSTDCCSTTSSSQLSSSSLRYISRPNDFSVQDNRKYKIRNHMGIHFYITLPMLTQCSSLGILAFVPPVPKHNASKWDRPN